MPVFDEWGNIFPWKQQSWLDRVKMIFFFFIMYGIIVPVMFFGAILVIGMIIEGIAQKNTTLESCQKHAKTPYEYHQCR